MVIWSRPAKSDLRQIHDFIARDSRVYAQKVVNAIIGKSALLDTFPKMGRIVPEMDNPEIREIFIYCYRLIYEIKTEQIQVLALIHVKRNLESDVFDELNKELAQTKLPEN
jgi:toxin ParE1/3/4